MSFLWTNNRSNNKQYRMPSPTYKKVVSDRKSRIKNNIPLWFTRRMSSFASFLGQKRWNAGMTVEASIVLPLFMFFFLHLMGSVEMIRLHGKLTFAMWNAGKQLTVYTAVADTAGMDVPDVGVSYVYVLNSVGKLLGGDYLDTSPLVYGKNGLNFLSSDYDKDMVDIGLTYQVEPKVTIFPFRYVRMANRFLGRSWTGYDVQGSSVKYVYVTQYGEVWHATPDCTHIRIDVLSVSAGDIGNKRNNNGGRYSLCELCEDEKQQALVYYTPQGERYHRSAKCSSLIRYVRAIVWETGIPYRPCGRCAKEAK